MRLMSAKQCLYFLCKATLFNNFSPYCNTYFANHTQNISFGIRRRWTYNKIGRSQGIEMRNMAVYKMCSIEQFPDFFGSRSGYYTENTVNGFSCSHVVTTGAYAAYLCYYLRNFFNRASFNKFFKSAEFGNLKIYIFNIAVIGQEYFYFPMTFQSGYGEIKSGGSSRGPPLRSSHPTAQWTLYVLP